MMLNIGFWTIGRLYKHLQIYFNGILRARLNAIIFSILLLCLPDSYAIAGVTSNFLQVSNTYRQLVDQHGNWIRLKGVNYNLIQGSVKHSPDPTHIAHIANWGFNFIRFSINWAFLEPTPGNINWSYIDEIEHFVQMANQYGIYVLIDMHQWNTSPCFTYAFGNGFPTWFVNQITFNNFCSQNNNQTGMNVFWKRFWDNPTLVSGPYSGKSAWDVYADAWRTVVWRLRNYSNIVGWDILNEPYLGANMDSSTFNSTILPNFYIEVGNRIRWSDWTDGDIKHHVLFIEGEDGGITSALTKPNLSNFVLSPHFYINDTSLWDNCSELANGTSSSPGVHDGLNKGQAWGVPVVFGEFGSDSSVNGCPTSSGPLFAQYVSRIISVNGQSWAWWDFGPPWWGDGCNMELVTTSLQDQPAVGNLFNNLMVYSGPECP